ncbi:hypothetical protein [Xanthomonas hortorum]|uniref:hypothetical protein n=1 Tax=Xanthomonas hortorum TaxID=56454 RepID=UPI0021584E94|nr:hypothetical protein [Xanthomonas hortorum]
MGYSEATDLFNLLDNLSDWLPGFTVPVYRSYMEAHGGLDQADLAALAAYADFRRRTSGLAKDNDLEVVDRVFAPDVTREADPFSRHFLGSENFEVSANAAIAEQSADDQRLLRAYFARFVPRASRLIAVAPRFEQQMRVLSEELSNPAVSRLASQMRDFFAVPEPPVFEARFVWWPEMDTTQAKVRGRTMLLYSQHDAPSGTASMDWAPILLHELSHYLSAGQPSARKRMLAANFLRLCPSAATLRNRSTRWKSHWRFTGGSIDSNTRYVDVRCRWRRSGISRRMPIARRRRSQLLTQQAGRCRCSMTAHCWRLLHRPASR